MLEDSSQRKARVCFDRIECDEMEGIHIMTLLSNYILLTLPSQIRLNQTRALR